MALDLRAAIADPVSADPNNLLKANAYATATDGSLSSTGGKAADLDGKLREFSMFHIPGEVKVGVGGLIDAYDGSYHADNWSADLYSWPAVRLCYLTMRCEGKGGSRFMGTSTSTPRVMTGNQQVFMGPVVQFDPTAAQQMTGPAGATPPTYDNIRPGMPSVFFLFGGPRTPKTAIDRDVSVPMIMPGDDPNYPTKIGVYSISGGRHSKYASGAHNPMKDPMGGGFYANIPEDPYYDGENDVFDFADGREAVTWAKGPYIGNLMYISEA